MEQHLRCNNQKGGYCRAELTNTAVVTTCSHVNILSSLRLPSDLLQSYLLSRLLQKGWPGSRCCRATYLPSLHDCPASHRRCCPNLPQSYRGIQDQHSQWARSEHHHGVCIESFVLLDLSDHTRDVSPDLLMSSHAPSNSMQCLSTPCHQESNRQIFPAQQRPG